jgi:hypothetical protein
MELPAHTRERIAEIRAIHVLERRRIRVGMGYQIVDWCKYCCGVGCRQRQWADDVEAGRRKPAGWMPAARP